MATNIELLSIEKTENTSNSQEEWFSVVGDLDDFIFYGQNIAPSSER